MRNDHTESSSEFSRFRMRTGATVTAIIMLLIPVTTVSSSPLPWSFDLSLSPVIYDNDWDGDVYTGEYLMALSSAGAINLVGMVSTATCPTDESWCNPSSNCSRNPAQMQNMINSATNSGIENIPSIVHVGPCSVFSRPGSGNPDDTIAKNSDGGRFIRDAALNATPEHPLIVVVGGPLTTVADAYLLNPGIADRIVVFYNGGNVETGYSGYLYVGYKDYNSDSDMWAASICVRRLKMVLLGKPFFKEPNLGGRCPVTYKNDILLRLPNTPLRQFMYDKDWPSLTDGANSRDADAPPAIALLARDYVTDWGYATYDFWDNDYGTKLKWFTSGTSEVIQVKEADRNVATSTWWDGMMAYCAWNPNDPSCTSEELHAVTDLVAAATNQSIQLTWTDTNDNPNEDGHLVQRKPYRSDFMDYHTIAVLEADITSYTDTTELHGQVEYTYRVGAYCNE